MQFLFTVLNSDDPFLKKETQFVRLIVFDGDKWIRFILKFTSLCRTDVRVALQAP
jgi:hypothetical protein